MDDYPKWFWHVIEQTKPDKEVFKEWLKLAEKERIVQFYFAFRTAASDVTDFSDGIGDLSEDGMEDFCLWIVSQGRDFWLKAMAENSELEWFADVYDEARRAGQPTQYPVWFKRGFITRYFNDQFDEDVNAAAIKFGEAYSLSINWLPD